MAPLAFIGVNKGKVEGFLQGWQQLEGHPGVLYNLCPIGAAVKIPALHPGEFIVLVNGMQPSPRLQALGQA